MTEYLDKNDAWSEGALQDWYMNSIDDTIPPIWTEDHISELCNDFYIISKDAPIIDAAPIIHAHWIKKHNNSEKPFDHRFQCSHCGHLTPENGYIIAPDYCGGCGAVMDEKKRNK